MTIGLNSWYSAYLQDAGTKIAINIKGDSAVIPSDYYPLNGRIEIFHTGNTEQITNKNVLSLFDSVRYMPKHCYTNTQHMYEAFNASGYPLDTYVGWLFTAPDQYPIHHCWGVYDHHSVIDLSDSFTVMMSGKNGERFATAKNNELKALMDDFEAHAMQQPNSIRCYPTGRASRQLLYVGSKCSPDEGRRIYRDLIMRYPDHKCRP